MEGFVEIWFSDTPPNSLKDSNVSPKVKIMEKEIVRVQFLARSTLGVKGMSEALGWGLGRVISESIIHIDLHKPNNNFVNA
jgi:hypothetical protein